MPSSSFTADARILVPRGFTADVVIKRSYSTTLTTDAEIAPRRFTADAWLLGERWRHHRVRDHFGADSDLYVVLSSDVGPYVAGTPIHWVIADLIERLRFIEDYDRTKASITADAWLALSGTYGRGVWRADAVIFKAAIAGSFTADAVLIRGASFTANAYIRFMFTVDAFIA